MDAIIDEPLWGEVHRKLTENRVDRANGIDAARPKLLAGLIYDGAGERMIPSHANKKGTRYRYYAIARAGQRKPAQRAARPPRQPPATSNPSSKIASGTS